MATASKLPAGSLDPTFGNGGKAFPVYPSDPDGNIRNFTVAPDGKLVLAGTFGDDYAIVRLEEDGSCDQSFGQGGVVTGKFGNGYLSRGASIILLEDGKILLTGRYYTTELAPAEQALARHHHNGSLDTQFGDHGTLVIQFALEPGEASAQAPELKGQSAQDSADRVLLLPDGKILLIHTGAILARLNLDGSFDTGFNEGRGFTVIRHPDYGIGITTQLLQPDGKIIVAGTAIAPEGSLVAAFIARCHADGTVDRAFGNSGFFIHKHAEEHRYLSSLALLKNGNIIACGATFKDLLSQHKCLLLSVTNSGTFDPLFNNGQPLVTVEDDNPSGYEWISVATQPDTKIVVQGNSLGRREEVDVFLRRYSAFGKPDLDFGDETGLVRTQVGDSTDIGLSMRLDGNRIVVAGLYATEEGFRPFVLRYLS